MVEKVTIELRPHIGVTRTEAGPLEVEHPQWIVVADLGYRKCQIGYIGHAAGTGFNGTSEFEIFNDTKREQMIDQVTDARDQRITQPRKDAKPGTTAVPPSVD